MQDPGGPDFLAKHSDTYFLITIHRDNDDQYIMVSTGQLT